MFLVLNANTNETDRHRRLVDHLRWSQSNRFTLIYGKEKDDILEQLLLIP